MISEGSRETEDCNNFTILLFLLYQINAVISKTLKKIVIISNF